MSQYERSGWRDEWISRRHRTWGYNVPAVDLDCIITASDAETGENGWNVVEYDHKQPVAIIEYKSYKAIVNTHDANISTLRNLAEMAGLPFFIVVYSQTPVRFGVRAMNAQAKTCCPTTIMYDEAEYVQWLHYLRGRAKAPTKSPQADCL